MRSPRSEGVLKLVQSSAHGQRLGYTNQWLKILCLAHA